ncbi:MAG: hypothetical protein OEW64_12685 [Gammaproteobacteria bacterium]|nr:hypothetical protein [Gammaproteobacteria bacterium]MDH5304938.1 hypothetical protein [Gammaproteobacteria bacterium]MDH5323472.1 hypothetical protein [Gammaproteobacteria bacterium]
MARQSSNGDDRQRRVLAQETARIIVDHGIRDYRIAKIKAAERLGLSTRGALPGNAEIEQAVSEHLLLFSGDAHAQLLADLRGAALAAMRLLAEFSPRLVGPVLAGTADENSVVNLHVFADSPESVAMFLDAENISCQLYERRLKMRPGRASRADVFSGYAFVHSGEAVEATVFPVDGIRQAPISPIDGKPMRRADLKGVRALLEKGL